MILSGSKGMVEPRTAIITSDIDVIQENGIISFQGEYRCRYAVER